MKMLSIINDILYAYLNTYVNILFFIKIYIKNSPNKLHNFWYKRSATGHAALLTHFQSQLHDRACGYGMLARRCTKLVTAALKT